MMRDDPPITNAGRQAGMSLRAEPTRVWAFTATVAGSVRVALARLPAALAGLLLVVTAPFAVAEEFVNARSLGFMEARGGVVVGEPERGNRGWILPITCDVSGVSSINKPGNVLHRRLAWWRSVAAVDGRRISLTIETALQGPDAPSARCGPAELGEIPDGEYEVVYRDPDGNTHAMRRIVITR